MCGRYASSRKPEDLIEEFEVDTNMVKESLEPDYNVAPTKDVYAVMDRLPRDAPKDAAPERRLTTVRWGLVPSWAKDLSIGNRMINARLETLAREAGLQARAGQAPMPASCRRLLRVVSDAAHRQVGKPLKQPFFIHPSDGSVMAMAGLYEIWRNTEVDDDAPGAVRLVGHGDHHHGRGLCRAHPRPDADAGRAVRATQPGSTPPSATPVTWLNCWCPPRPVASRPTRSPTRSTTSRNNGRGAVGPDPARGVRRLGLSRPRP